MKKYFAGTSALLVLLLSGCATATFTQGRPFDTSKVSSLQKGTTTKQEVLAWFGEPFTKTVAGSDGETWFYMYTQGTSKAQSYVFSVDVKTEGNMKKLDVLMKNDIVENYTYSDGGLPGTMTIQNK
jgi:outer membrane protein assembly factor BamE (lipoprotein component of BamABCDE complex)